MSEYKFELKGKSGLVLGLLFMVVCLVGYSSKNASLQKNGKEMIIEYLHADYTRIKLPNLQSRLAENISDEEKDDLIDRFFELGKIEIQSIEMLGKRDKGHVVRVDVSLSGEVPPDGKSSRYFLMKHSIFYGWRIERETYTSSFNRVRRSFSLN